MSFVKWIQIEKGRKGIKRILFLKPSLLSDDPKLRSAIKKLLGSKPTMDLSNYTPFQRSVWKALQKIPVGETRSYQWVAKKIGKPKAVRAVGQAVGANPIPIIIPCHRVIRSDGTIGGFSSGLKWKRFLLTTENPKLK